jgi:hypothetical protein
MNKLTFDQWKNSMSFMIDDTFDTQFLGSLKNIIQHINEVAFNLSDKSQLAVFLTTSNAFSPELKLKALVSLIGLSEERLKRVISLVRFKFLDQGFNSEWSVNQISGAMISNLEFRKLLIDFFLNGRNSLVGEHIPLYYMRNFRLSDPDFIEDLQDYNYVNRILNDNELQGKYSNMVGAHVESLIKDTLQNYKDKFNPQLTYEMQKEYPLFNKNIDFLIPNLNSPVILIESSYNITTGSGQSKRADQLVELYSILFRRNTNFKQKIIMVNYCDGFGWVGRQTDLRRIYDASNYVINQQNLYLLDGILDEHYI